VLLHVIVGEVGHGRCPASSFFLLESHCGGIYPLADQSPCVDKFVASVGKGYVRVAAKVELFTFRAERLNVKPGLGAGGHDPDGETVDFTPVEFLLGRFQVPDESIRKSHDKNPRATSRATSVCRSAMKDSGTSWNHILAKNLSMSICYIDRQKQIETHLSTWKHGKTSVRNA